MGLFSSCSCRWTSLIYYSSYITLFWCLNFHSHDFMLKNILKPSLCISQQPRSWVSPGSLPLPLGAGEEGLAPWKQAGRSPALWWAPSEGSSHRHRPAGPAWGGGGGSARPARPAPAKFAAVLQV